MIEKPKLSENQIKLLTRLVAGEKGNIYSYQGGRDGWIGKDHAKYSTEDAGYLAKQGLAIRISTGISDSHFEGTKLGKDWLDDKWIDPKSEANDKILAKPVPEADGFEESEPKEKSNDVLGDETTHESYGTIGISHSSGGGNLFNTTVDHDHQVRLSIKKASLRRGLNNDSVYGGEELIEVSMSHEQFVSLLFTPNRGSGTPCTIGRFNGKMMESPPRLTNKRSQFSEEFKDTLSDLSRDAKSLQAEANRLLERGSLKKAERERLKSLLTAVASSAPSHFSFIESQFQEQLDKSVSEAESQVQGAISATLKNMGLEHLVNQLDISKSVAIDVDNG